METLYPFLPTTALRRVSVFSHIRLFPSSCHGPGRRPRSRHVDACRDPLAARRQHSFPSPASCQHFFRGKGPRYRPLKPIRKSLLLLPWPDSHAGFYALIIPPFPLKSFPYILHEAKGGLLALSYRLYFPSFFLRMTRNAPYLNL